MNNWNVNEYKTILTKIGKISNFLQNKSWDYQKNTNKKSSIVVSKYLLARREPSYLEKKRERKGGYKVQKNGLYGVKK